MMQELTVLSVKEFIDLKTSLKTDGLDLCYSAPCARPIRMRWSPERLSDTKFIAKIAQRRPQDPSYRIASVAVTDPGNWLRSARLDITFYAVNTVQDEALKQHLETYPVGYALTDRPPGQSEADDHISVKSYVQVAVVLAVMTAVEVALLYLPDGLRPPRWSLLIVLMLLSALKFGIVASFFMHLRYDNRLYAGFFIGGLVVAVSTIFALLALFREPSRPLDVFATVDAQSHTLAVISPPSTMQRSIPGVSSGPKSLPSGANVFEKNGCGACHAVSTVSGARGTIGPALDGLAQRAPMRTPGLSAEAYIRQSIEAPNDYVVKGYLKVMPSLRPQMSDTEFLELVNWLRAL